jgi:5-methylcytosine-specific restriction endonuclease McrBC regulatory subunit McrC
MRVDKSVFDKDTTDLLEKLRAARESIPCEDTSQTQLYQITVYSNALSIELANNLSIMAHISDGDIVGKSLDAIKEHVEILLKDMPQGILDEEDEVCEKN